MKRLMQNLEKTFMAASFAEAGEHGTAMKIAGIKPALLTKFVRDTFAAVAFAEADCPDMALEMIGPGRKNVKRESLDTFLQVAGLQGVRVHYGLARI